MTDEKKPKPLIERRQAFAERQAAKGLGLFAGQTSTMGGPEGGPPKPPRAAVADKWRHLEPMGTGPENRHGMPKLPVGQREVKNWPVLDLGDVPSIDLAAWRLTVDGSVERPLSLTWDDFMALPQVEDTSDFHCVTTWSRMDNRWRGVRFTDLCERAGVLPEARFVFVTAYDHAPGTRIPYTTNLSLDDALAPDVLIVHTWEGKPLPIEHGGPARMITPRLYAWKGAKWIRRITLLAQDSPGFWEQRGYSSTAYPWFDDRFNR